MGIETTLALRGTFPVPPFLPQIQSLQYPYPSLDTAGAGDQAPPPLRGTPQGPLCGSGGYVSEMAQVKFSGSWDQARPLLLYSACCLLVPLLPPHIPLLNASALILSQIKYFFKKSGNIQRTHREGPFHTHTLENLPHHDSL